jgi:predicted nucleic acid-binding protein
MIYLDTSVLVALFTNEASASHITLWYADETRLLTSGDWCMTEFASALALKKRTRQLSCEQCDTAWQVFCEFCSSGLRLLPLEREVFTHAAQLIRDSDNGLRAGDALHLALALHVRAEAFFTLDTRLAASAQQNGLSLITTK